MCIRDSFDTVGLKAFVFGVDGIDKFQRISKAVAATGFDRQPQANAAAAPGQGFLDVARSRRGQRNTHGITSYIENELPQPQVVWALGL